MDTIDAHEDKEMTSSTQLSVCALDETGKKGNEIGTIRMEKGKIVIQSADSEDQQLVSDIFRDAFVPQLGIPVVSKADERAVSQLDGKVSVSGYKNFTNASADEVLVAFMEYVNLLGIFTVEQAQGTF